MEKMDIDYDTIRRHFLERVGDKKYNSKTWRRLINTYGKRLKIKKYAARLSRDLAGAVFTESPELYVKALHTIRAMFTGRYDNLVTSSYRVKVPVLVQRRDIQAICHREAENKDLLSGIERLLLNPKSLAAYIGVPGVGRFKMCSSTKIGEVHVGGVGLLWGDSEELVKKLFLRRSEKKQAFYDTVYLEFARELYDIAVFFCVVR